MCAESTISVDESDDVLDDHEFALCLTHDVDRPYKSLPQSLYYAASERAPSHLARRLLGENPYWQFEEITALEDDMGVRSAFYFLNEPHIRTLPLREWVRSVNWIQHLGRYDLTDPAIVDAIEQLDDGGWEVGLHGSYHSYCDPARLRHEKAVLEEILGHEIRGGRQHYLNLDVPETWRIHADLGLAYDASLGSSTEAGFRYGYRPIRPFDESPFVVIPLTAMEVALPSPGEDFDAAWSVCEELLTEAAEHGAVMSVLWHPRYFAEREFPGFRRLYRRLVSRALAGGAWVGPPGELVAELDLDDSVRGPHGEVLGTR